MTVKTGMPEGLNKRCCTFFLVFINTRPSEAVQRTAMYYSGSSVVGKTSLIVAIGLVSKYRLFILDLLSCDHSCISGDIALRIQHDISRCHTKTLKPGHPPRRFLTSGITSFSIGYNSPNNKLKTPLRN